MFTLAASAEALEKGYEAYERYGFAGLFVIVFLAVLIYLFWERGKIVSLTEKTTRVIEQSNAANHAVAGRLEALEDAATSQREQNIELMTYLKTRDQILGGRGR